MIRFLVEIINHETRKIYINKRLKISQEKKLISIGMNVYLAASNTNRKELLCVQPRISSKLFINQLIRLHYTSLDSKNTKKNEGGKNGVVVLDQQKWRD